MTNRMLNAKIFGAEESLLDVEDGRESGPHIPLSVIPPNAKSTCADNDDVTSRTPMMRLVEYNWHLGSLGPSSYDKLAGSSMRTRMSNLDQVQPKDRRLFLNRPTNKRVSTQDDLGLSPQSLTRAVPAPNTARTCTDVDTDPDLCATRNAFGSNPVGAGNDPRFSAIVDMKAASPSLLTTRYGTGQRIDLRR
jgi:hypothetical protein